MQEKEPTALKHSQPSDPNDKPTDEQNASAGNDNGKQDKIAAIHASLSQIERKEDEEAVSIRVAWQIKQAKERREHPENFPPPSPKRKKRRRAKKSVGRRVLELFPQRGDSGGEIARKSIFLFSLVVFLVCVGMIAIYLVDLYRADTLYDELGAAYHRSSNVAQAVAAGIATDTTETSVAEAGEEEESSVPEKTYTLLPGMQDLLDINEEVVGWLTIPDTQIDYPVMQHENDTAGDEYYLHRDINQDYSYPGSIFMDYRCNFDKVGADKTLEVENSDNLIIYGHNMRDMSMFGTLKYYRNDDDYYEEHPIIELSSNYETYQYKIFAYFLCDADDTTETRFDYWNKIEFADESEFYAYVNEVKRRTLRITNIDVTYGDDLLTLSTCNSTFDTARLVIVARRVRDGEDPYDRVKGSAANPNIKWPSVYYLWHEDTYDPDAPFVPYG